MFKSLAISKKVSILGRAVFVHNIKTVVGPFPKVFPFLFAYQSDMVDLIFY